MEKEKESLVTKEESLTAKEEGILEIQQAPWEKDDYNTLNLHVHNAFGQKVHAWLELRSKYCDRGHIQFMLDGPGSLNIVVANSFPRFYMNIERAKAEAKEYLMWRLWNHRVNPPITEINSFP